MKSHISIVTKLIIIAGLCIGTILPGYSQQSSEKTLITAMSFNVRYFNTSDGVHAWANRKEKVAEVIKSNNVDIAGLQEPWMNQIQDLALLLPEYAWFGWGRDEGNEKGEFTPIFYKKDKFTVLDKGIFWLSTTPEIPGSKGWDVRFPRMVPWGHFKNKADGKEFYFFNTHLGGNIARFEGAKIIRNKIDQMSGGLPVIVTGDFNATPVSKPYEVMLSDDYSVKLVDGFDVAKEKNDEQFTNYLFDGNDKDLKRIDYIFVSKEVEVLYHEIINKRIGKYYPSDHLALKAELAF
ncbi:MAG: endonuclease [SAR86 cluster bacterium]|uniref:Endonuclease n=1 Tax=SAR86 cluster bacterium TaxID=2030880 RepID=A0A2A5B179_9GAMM|nr:MAG: endonuclease [SAR86 cluster bacterium]